MMCVKKGFLSTSIPFECMKTTSQLFKKNFALSYTQKWCQSLSQSDCSMIPVFVGVDGENSHVLYHGIGKFATSSLER